MNRTFFYPLNDSEDLNSTSVQRMDEEELVYWETVLSDSRYTAQRILVPIVLIVGAIGNSITIAVLTRRHMQTSTNLYLSALAISDILYLVFMFSLSLRHSPGMSHRDNWVYWHYYRYALWLTDASSSTSIWLTVTFTVERYIAVCHPIKGKVFCTQSRAKRVILAMYVLCFLLTITTPHEWVVVPDDRKNGTHLTLEDSELGMNQTYRKTFYWFSAVTFILLPLTLLAAFNTFLILAVKRSRKQRNVIAFSQRDSTSTQENKITVMLIAVVLLALVCQLPTAAMLIYTSFHQLQEGTVELYVCTILNNFFNLLTAVNAAANFVFYCALSDRYRRTFLQTFCRKWYQSHSPPPSWIATTGYTNFEEGSPRASLRGSMRCSSLRASRRSSYRSSPSSTSSPRASPSHSYGRGIDRHSHGGSFLRVPPRDLTQYALQEEITDAIYPSSNSYLLKHSFHNGEAREHNKLSYDEKRNRQRSCSSKFPTDTIKITADSEIVPHLISDMQESKTIATHPLVRWLRSLRLRKLPTPSVTHVSRSQSILIRCQPPSLEDQTAV